VSKKEREWQKERERGVAKTPGKENKSSGNNLNSLNVGGLVGLFNRRKLIDHFWLFAEKDVKSKVTILMDKIPSYECWVSLKRT
jgi:hypothetical protein